MIDPQRFVRGNMIDEKALQEVAVRRLKTDLSEAKGFQEREVRPLPYTPTDDEAEAYERLLAFTKRRDKAVAADGGSRSARDMATLLLKKRFFSSPVAFARTVDVYRDTRTRGPRRRLRRSTTTRSSASTPTSSRRARSTSPSSQTLQRDQERAAAAERRGPRRPRLAQRLGAPLRGPARLRSRRCSTYIEGTLRPTGDWSNERIVIFTEYVDTLDWIRDILRQQGYEDDRVEVIDGGTDAETRELIRARFNEDPAEDAGADPARHRRRRRGHRPAAPLPPTGQLRHPVQPQPARAAHRPRSTATARPTTPEIRHFAPVADGDSALGQDVELLARVAAKIAQIMHDLGRPTRSSPPTSSASSAAVDERRQRQGREGPDRRDDAGREACSTPS